MHRTNPDIDIIMYVLKAVMAAQPHSVFAKSLYQQYCERGGLSKKQLEGLHSKASKIEGIHPGRLATLEAIILKKYVRHRSETPQAVQPIHTKDEAVGEQLRDILEKYPQHKRVLLFKSKYDNNDLLSAADLTELKKFHQLLIRK
jgi:hypothetical protein